MTERTESGGSVGIGPSLRGLLVVPGGRLILFGVAVLLIVGGTIVGYVLGQHFASRDLAAATQLNQQLQSQDQILNRQIIEQSTKLSTLQTTLTKVQNALNTIMPAERTYNVNPNQSLVVADGRLTVGLIGSPSNDGININVNGKQHFVAAGDVVNIALDPSTGCQVAVQSFDMFKAVLTASCAASKPQ